MDPERMIDAVIRSEVRTLQEAYADAVSQRDWAEVASLFLADAPVELDLGDRQLSFVGGDEFAAFVGPAVDRFAFFQFGLLGTRLELRIDGDVDRATGRMYMTERRQTPDGHWSQIYGIYHDAYQRTDDGWRLAARRYRSLARRLGGAELLDLPEPVDLTTWPVP